MIVVTDPHLGKIVIPALMRSISLPGRGVRPAHREVGIFVAVQRRPRLRDDGLVLGFDTIWASVSHNERVDAGADKQSRQCFGAGASPGAPSATAYFNAIAIANAALTKTKTDQSLGSASSGVTTNEFTTLGLARATATTPVGGDYTAPSTLGGTFSQVVKKTFTAGGNATAKGAGLFDSTTPASSILYAEDNFSSDAVLVLNDTLAVTITVTN